MKTSHHWVLLDRHPRSVSAEVLVCYCGLSYDHDEEGLEVDISGSTAT